MSLCVVGFLIVNVQFLVLVKRNFFRDSTFATVSFSAFVVRSRRSSVSTKSVKTVEFGRLNISKLKAKLSVNSKI